MMAQLSFAMAVTASESGSVCDDRRTAATRTDGTGHGAQSGCARASGGPGLLLIVVVLWLCTGMAAQCPVRNPDDQLPPPLSTVSSSTRQGEPRLPESGYLSNASYASTYFGFVFDLPIPLEGHRVMLPLMPPGQHALLAVGFQEGDRSGTLLITASEPPNAVHEMIGERAPGGIPCMVEGRTRARRSRLRSG